jgi:hypothetical protein
VHLKDDQLVTGLADQEGGLDLLAAAYARVPTAAGFTRMLTPLGNYFIARPVARAAAKHITEETDVPLDAAVVLGLTRDALHVWKADPMLDQVHDYLGQVPVDRITAITVTPGRSWQDMEITLDGGHQVNVEARGASHAIASAFSQLKGSVPGQ